MATKKAVKPRATTAEIMAAAQQLEQSMAAHPGVSILTAYGALNTHVPLKSIRQYQRRMKNSGTSIPLDAIPATAPKQGKSAWDKKKEQRNSTMQAAIEMIKMGLRIIEAQL